MNFRSLFFVIILVYIFVEYWFLISTARFSKVLIMQCADETATYKLNKMITIPFEWSNIKLTWIYVIVLIRVLNWKILNQNLYILWYAIFLPHIWRGKHERLIRFTPHPMTIWIQKRKLDELDRSRYAISYKVHKTLSWKCHMTIIML